MTRAKQPPIIDPLPGNRVDLFRLGASDRMIDERVPAGGPLVVGNVVTLVVVADVAGHESGFDRVSVRIISIAGIWYTGAITHDPFWPALREAGLFEKGTLLRFRACHVFAAKPGA